MLAVYPGSFDPPTDGHLDIITRAAAIADKLIVAVLTNDAKTPLLSTGERVSLLKEIAAGLPNVEVASFSGLTVDFARLNRADVIIRGLRSGADFDYELPMAQTNCHLSGIETVFLPASPGRGFVVSTLVREIARLGGDVSGLVPNIVSAVLERKIKGE